jgi:hypothetical protein
MLMTRPRFLVLAFVAVSTCVGAQQPASLNGRWQASFAGEGGGQRAATLSLSDDGGLWRDIPHGNQARAKSRANACLVLHPAVAIADRTPNNIAFQILYSKALAGCTDESVTAHAVDEKTLEGTFEDGRAIKLVRE